ncbi:MAG: hypothetical protein WDN24_12145 [Sphingomonas sp.]
MIRDPAAAANIALPIFDREAVREGVSAEAMRSGGALHHSRFIFQYGQPSAVRAAQEHAMGLMLEARGYVDG